MYNEENRQTDKKVRGRTLLKVLKGSKLLFTGSILSSSLASLCDMLNPQIIRAAIDNAIGGKPSDFPVWVNGLAESAGGFEYLGKHLWIMALALVAVALIKVAAQYGNTMLNTRASEVMVKNARDGLFDRIVRLPYSWHMSNRTGDIIQRCTNDLDRIRGFVAEQLTSVFRISVYIALSLVFMFSMNVELSLVAALPIPFIILYSVVFRKNMEEGFKACYDEEDKVSSIVQESLSGIRVVRAFAKEDYENRRFEKAINHYSDMWVKMGPVMGKFFSTQDFLSGAQVMLVTVFGAVFAIRGVMSSGEYVAFIAYNAMLSFPVRRLGRMISEMSRAGVSLDRISYIYESEPEDMEDGGEADMRGDICFENVSFSYEGSAEVLRDVSFTVKGGSTLGILGGTGSGKSTLMLLLDKMYSLPEGGGRISIGGTDIKEIKASYLRENISIVLQEPYLFSRTIGENIGIVNPDVSAEGIESAATAACLDESIKNFAKGYETFVGEKGVTLSGGQKQRAAIARALTKHTPIMIFDDSLSAVDNETDAKIRASLEQRFGQSTIIIISHRITTLSRADKVIVLDRGRIMQEGSPEELKNAPGIYSRIHDIQLGSREEEHE